MNDKLTFEQLPSAVGQLLEGFQNLQKEVSDINGLCQTIAETNARMDMKQPIITVLDRLTEKVQNDNKIQNVQIGLFRLEIADFSEKVFQEALLNALSHRDYQQLGAVYVNTIRIKL